MFNLIKQIRAKKRKGVKKMSEIRVKDNESIDLYLTAAKCKDLMRGIIAPLLFYTEFVGL